MICFWSLQDLSANLDEMSNICFCHPLTKFHSNLVCNSSFFGSPIGDLFCRKSEMFHNSWNISSESCLLFPSVLIDILFSLCQLIVRISLRCLSCSSQLRISLKDETGQGNNLCQRWSTSVRNVFKAGKKKTLQNIYVQLRVLNFFSSFPGFSNSAENT